MSFCFAGSVQHTRMAALWNRCVNVVWSMFDAICNYFGSFMLLAEYCTLKLLASSDLRALAQEHRLSH
jgi:hypothetical protein